MVIILRLLAGNTLGGGLFLCAVHCPRNGYPKEEIMFTGFRQFMMRSNVLDLAVAVVIGAAFGAVVTALVKDLLTPLIAAIIGKPDFSAIAFEVNGSKFLIGDFINAILSFILIAAAV
jgi:large conductance mechanosensitive channel